MALTLLATLPSVLGQGFIPQVPREVPSRAGVINDSPTAGPWVPWMERGEMALEGKS